MKIGAVNPTWKAGDGCPAGVQDAVDDMYSDCGGECDFDAEMKTNLGSGQDVASGLKTIECSGAAQTVPALAVVAALVGHFLN